jgi:hypothetical protein
LRDSKPYKADFRATTDKKGISQLRCRRTRGLFFRSPRVAVDVSGSATYAFSTLSRQPTSTSISSGFLMEASRAARQRLLFEPVSWRSARPNGFGAISMQKGQLPQSTRACRAVD